MREQEKRTVRQSYGGVCEVLSVYFGEKENVMHGPSWFRFNYKPEWFEDSLVQKMLVDVDKSEYVGGELIQSSVLGPIPPGRLSGGVQTLISIYKKPELMFNATSCGENCAKWLAKIGEIEDVSINQRYDKSKLNDFYLEGRNKDAILNVLPGELRELMIN